MSKMDALRAMREAKFAANAKRTAPAKGAGTTARKAAPATPAAARSSATRSAAPAAATEPAGDADVTEALCGHRNMSGRTCTREAGHAAKSHRYS